MLCDRFNYLKDPEKIYAKSFATIRSEADFSAIDPACHGVAERVVHACGMVDVITDLRISADLPDAVCNALAAGKPVLVDCEMVRSAIIRRFLPDGTLVICTLNDEQARTTGKEHGITRSAAAVSLWAEHLADAVVVIGNAPTALFALLESIDGGGHRPAAIIAMPVGFVGAAESKHELHSDPRGIPFATVLGRRGGSAMAAAAFNAITSQRR